MFGIKQEPAIVLGAVSEVLRAIVPTMIIFGLLQWNEQQVAQVMLLGGVVVKSLEVVLTRQNVVPTEKANAQILTATRMPEGTSVQAVIDKTEKDANL